MGRCGLCAASVLFIIDSVGNPLLGGRNVALGQPWLSLATLTPRKY